MANSKLHHDSDGKLSKFAWPGGYPIFYVDGRNCVLCPDCADKAENDPDEYPDWKPQTAHINYEDSLLMCDGCNMRIESAYAEDQPVMEPQLL